jgi:hypothetical protein
MADFMKSAYTAGMKALAVLLLASLAGASGLETKVTVKVRHAALTSFLDKLSRQAKINFVLAEGLEKEKVTAFLNDVTVEEALEVIKQIKGLDYKRLGSSETFLIGRKESLALHSPSLIDGGPELDRKVTVALRGAPLDKFLHVLSEQTQANFALDESLGSQRVTVFLENVTAREALETVLTVKNLSCRRLKGKAVYEVAGRDAALKREIDSLEIGQKRTFSGDRAKKNSAALIPAQAPDQSGQRRQNDHHDKAAGIEQRRQPRVGRPAGFGKRGEVRDPEREKTQQASEDRDRRRIFLLRLQHPVEGQKVVSDDDAETRHSEDASGDPQGGFHRNLV